MSESSRIQICMVAAEAAPYAVAGEISEVLQGLPEALRDLGHEVRVFLPLYKCVEDEFNLERICDLETVTIGRAAYRASLLADSSVQPAVNYFIRCPDLFDRKGIYQDPATREDYTDNFERFDFFALASLDALQRLDWCPDILHCHDSHTALVPAYLKLLRMGDPFFAKISTVLTVYDLSYHAQYPAEKFRLTAIPGELFYPMGPFEYYGNLSTLKAGICYADAINAVSHQYAREIQTKEYGCGLEEALKMRRKHIFGVLNGIDTEKWDPETDPLLSHRFSMRDLSGRQHHKEALQHLCGLAKRPVALLGMIADNPNLDGTELFGKSWDQLRLVDCQWIVMGRQLPEHGQKFRKIADECPDRFAFLEGFDERLLHRFFAGTDIFLMPSRSQPCGLNHLYGMRYGAIPIVRHAGGLAETVLHYDGNTGKGHGFKFYGYDPQSLLSTIQDALRLWADDQPQWKSLMRNAMSQDLSWRKSAVEYESLYRRAMSHQ